MITIAFSWIIIFYTLFSLGDCFIYLYNKVCKNEEYYNILDSFILGICFVCIILPFSSFWLPANHYILFLYIIIGTLHWILNNKRLHYYLCSLKEFFLETNILQKFLIITPIVTILVYTYIFEHHYDAEYYHYQQIRWNEEYAVVPGLGNLEDRFGFNSNYLLISALFTFRFLFGDMEAIYVLQALFYTLLLIWIIIKIYSTNYDFKYIISLLLSFVIILIYGYMLSSSSTDIFPMLFILFYAIKTIENPKWIYEQPLLACILPVTMVTFKLSTAPFCIICLIVLFYLIKQKKRQKLYTIITLGTLTIIFWCIRNIIISGYLVYPIHQIDLFNFDWKVPKTVAFIHSTHIQHWGKKMFNLDMGIFFNSIIGATSIKDWTSFVKFVSLLLVIISPFFIVYKTIKKKINRDLLYLYSACTLCLIIGFLSAPDFRFIYGYILAIILLSCTIIIGKKVFSPRLGKYSTIFILLCLGAVSIHKFNIATKRIGATFKKPIDFIALYHHRSPKNIGSFDEYQIGDITIYLSATKGDNRTYDLLPATAYGGIPFEPSSGGLKIQNIKTIEPRGKDIQDGFRTKSEFIDIFESDIERFIKEYYIKVDK